MNALIAHVVARNIKTQVWVDAGPGRWAGMLSEDVTHWAERGIVTLEDFERDELESSIWEFYKDVHGIRPRWMNFKEMSLEQLGATMDSLIADSEEQDARQAVHEARSITALEARIEALIATGAGDRATAIRWIDQAEDTDGRIDYLEYTLNVPTGHIEKMLKAA